MQVANDWLPGPTLWGNIWESACKDIDGTFGIISGGRVSAGYLNDARLIDTTPGAMSIDPYPGGNHNGQHSTHSLNRVTLSDGNEYFITIGGGFTAGMETEKSMLPGLTTWVPDSSLENPNGIYPSHVTCLPNNAPSKIMCFHWKPDSNKVRLLILVMYGETSMNLVHVSGTRGRL